MLGRLPSFIVLPLLGLASLGGFYYARSAFDTTAPTIALSGLEADRHYAGTVPCYIRCKDLCKIHDISIMLDDKPLVSNYKVNRSECDYHFTIASESLPQGKHKLRIHVTDNSRNKNEALKEVIFFIDNLPLEAAIIKPDKDYKVFQGHALHVQFQANKDIQEAYLEALSQKYPCFRESIHGPIYECFLPIKCEEAPNEYIFYLVIVDKVGNKIVLENKFQVIMYPFKKQSLTIPEEKVKEAKAQGLPQKDLESEVEKATASSPGKKLWHGAFDVPIDMKGMSTDFGTLRTTQDRGRYRHNALDLLGVPRSVVWAPQDGIVVIKGLYEHSGNTVVLDHGYGLLSLYFHLDDLGPVNVGDLVKKGKNIGKIGKTGYASGYHLHWEIRLNNIQVNPTQWTKYDFMNQV